MVNAFCVLFADNYRNDDLQGLVRNRTLASLSVASRYRMVDFMLSSLVKAEVSNIAVVTNHHYKSLMDHLSWGKDWDLNRKNSGLKFITPMSNHLSNRVIHNKIEALEDALLYANGLLEEYCILADGNIVGNVDFKDMLKHHQETHADVTLAYTYRKPQAHESQIIFDENGKVYDSMYHPHGYNEVCATQVKIYIMSKELFKDLAKKGISLGWEDILKDFISKNLNGLNVFSYEIKNYNRTINSVQEYYNFNRDLLKPEILRELFLSGTDILTRVQDSVPTTYGENAIVKNSILGDGCEINGIVENSILFRDVVIEEGAVVKNSIIMPNTVVKKAAYLDYVISDKSVVISEKVELKGTDNCQVIVEKNKVVE